MAKSWIGSLVAISATISYGYTLHIAALVVAIISGSLSAGYTIYRWRKAIKNDK
jgi:hypothetical protein